MQENLDPQKKKSRSIQWRTRLTKGSAILLRSKRNTDMWNEAVVVDVNRTHTVKRRRFCCNACTQHTTHTCTQERVRLRQYRDGNQYSKPVSTGRLQLYVCNSVEDNKPEVKTEYVLKTEYVDVLSSRIRSLESSQIVTEEDSIVSKTTKWKDIVTKFSQTLEGRIQMFKYMCRCTKEDDVDTIVALIAAGVSVHVRSNKRGRTLMHFAAANGSSRCLEALLHYGADPCACDFQSRTPLHVRVFLLLLSYS
jgi:hypothetical protein